jgi:H+-transporting ATPase
LESHQEGMRSMSFSFRGPDHVEWKESTGLTQLKAEILLKKYGRNELAEEKTPKWLVFLKLLTPPMPCMIWGAIIVELIIENWPDAAILFGIQMMNASISFYETTKAGDAVAALKSALGAPIATCKRDGVWKDIPVVELVPGDLVSLAHARAIPADCIVHEGEIEVDQSALTGESLPVTMQKGSNVKMGSHVVKGEVHATVVKTGKNTFFGEAAELLKGDRQSSNLDKTLIRIILVLVIVSIILCGIAFVYLIYDEDVDVREALGFTVVLMVASIPLAVEIVCTTTLALGSRQMAVFGAIVSRLSAIEDLAGLTVLCSDKTGTLTLNKMMLQPECEVFIDGEDQDSILVYAAMAARWMEPPRDALDTLVLNACNDRKLIETRLNDEGVQQIDYMPFDPTIKRTQGTVEYPDLNGTPGKSFKTTKGAPDIIMALVDDDSIRDDFETKLNAYSERGVRCLAIAKTDTIDGKWRMAGLLTFLDPPRPDTKDTIERAQSYGVSVKMITGDHTLIARETARVLGMGSNIQNCTALPNLDENGDCPEDLVERYGQMIADSDGFAQMFPSHKFIVIEALRRMGIRVGMTGDGVNDAPALKKSDVGIAVCGSTDTAKAAADIILTQVGLSTIVDGIIVSRQIFQRMNSFLIYRIAATLQLLTFFFVAVLTMRPQDYEPDDAEWPKYFQMPVLLLMLITLLNDGTLISIGYDNVEASQYPNEWRLHIVFLISATLGFIACTSSLFLLWICLDSHREEGFLQHYLGFGADAGLSYGHITTMIYLKVSVSDFLTLFSARTGGKWFWQIKPAPILMAAGGMAISLSTILAFSWPQSVLDTVDIEGLGHHPRQDLVLWVWGYCLVVWFIQDATKVGMISFLYNKGFLSKQKTFTADSTEPSDKEGLQASLLPPSGSLNNFAAGKSDL